MHRNGIYLVSLVHCIRWLAYTDNGWKMRKKIDRTTLLVVLFMFVLSSVHTALADLERGRGDASDGRLPWSSVVMCTVTNIAVLIADSSRWVSGISHQVATWNIILTIKQIYRCWRVYACSLKRIAIPCLFWIGGFACTVLQLYWQVVQSAPIQAAWTLVNMSIGHGTVLTPFWASTIVVNVYATGMIVHRIWQAAKARSSEMPTTDLQFIMRVLIESGAIYALITIPHFIVWWTTSSVAIVILGWTRFQSHCDTYGAAQGEYGPRRADKPVVSEMNFASVSHARCIRSSCSHEFSSNQSTFFRAVGQSKLRGGENPTTCSDING
ncbi:hypothetical protein CPC08DRAFT_729866 [Agrocybe pediades]|nr:hypothetical protein CPC08DRAFT_729866 [Agrocybe pediades]